MVIIVRGMQSRVTILDSVSTTSTSFPNWSVMASIFRDGSTKDGFSLRSRVYGMDVIPFPAAIVNKITHLRDVSIWSIRLVPPFRVQRDTLTIAHLPLEVGFQQLISFEHAFP